MQRAQRAADSPLRAILEAAKVKRRVDPEAIDAEGAAGGTRRALAQRSPAPVAVAEPAPRGTAAVSPAALAPQPPSAPLAPVPLASPPAAPAGAIPKPGPISIRTLPGELAPPVPRADAARTGLAPVGRLELPALPPELPRVQAVPAKPAPAAPAAVAAAAAAAASTTAGEAPRLLHMVEPEVPIRVLESLTRREVTVEFIIGIDGDVSDVRVLPPAPRQLVRPVAAALEQWRYEAQRAPRANRVVLVFNGSR